MLDAKPAFSGQLWRWGFWLRVFGFGLLVTTNAPLFSERNGYKKALRVFGVKFEYLPRAG